MSTATNDHASGSTSDSAAIENANIARALAQFKRRRTTLKGACTRIEKYANSIRVVDEDVRAQARERRACLSGYWNEYHELQSRIEDLDVTEEKDREAFEDHYYAMAAKLERLCRPPVVATSARSTPTQSGGTENGGEAVNHVRLPKINMPSFSGKYEEWFPFHDSFQKLIHDNPTLPSIQKFQYLRAALTDDAKNVIENLEISDLNYELAWTMLRERYDNKRVIVNTHIRAIIELPRMLKKNVSELRRICDGYSRHLRALGALGRSSEYWDDIIIYIISAKLDSVTLREWHASLTGSELPELKKLTEFLIRRIQMLESVMPRDAISSGRGDGRAHGHNDNRRHALHAIAVGNKCGYCRGDHAIHACGAFAALSVGQRISEIRKLKICLNCLRSSTHRAAQCPAGTCRLCKLKHNSLLHLNQGPRDGTGGSQSLSLSAADDGAGPLGEVTAMLARKTAGRCGDCVFLSTAIIYVLDGNNIKKPARALLDSGSQASFITKKFIESLNLRLRLVNISITGVGAITTQASQAARIKICSRANSYSTNIECIVTNEITDRIPTTTVRRDKIIIPANLELADPQCYKAASVDILIGADIFWELVCVGQIRATSQHPTLQKTRLGWILAGRVTGDPRVSLSACAVHAAITNADLHERVERFWQIDELTESPSRTVEEKECEGHFIGNHEIDATGRYVVKLPIKERVMAAIGRSREIAERRFYNLEKKFERDAALKEKYVEFLKEYLNLGHMREVSAREVDRPGSIYLLHHGVYRAGDPNAKLRVVFDASCKTSSGVSLNDALLKGPTIQQDLISILMRFRSFAYVFAADIVKMYRQIRLHASQTHWQRIIWRESRSSPLSTFELNTVTYGTTSAPFLATRCLQHLAQKHAAEYPIGSRHILRDFYVDDVLTGANTLAEGRRARDEMIKVLRRSRFELGKWFASHKDLIPDDAAVGRETMNFDGDDCKILGIQWNPVDDMFNFKNNYEYKGDRVTKRTILAEVASVFDPLGMLGPVIVIAKIILQDMWQLKINWDESLRQNVHRRWMQFRDQLRGLSELRVPRWTGSRGTRRYQLHGFCDASEKAYGACVYVRTNEGTSGYRVVLLASKSRVAPIKAMSLPRLELSAAVLLSRLVGKVRDSFDGQQFDIGLWTDSMIAMQWIASPSRRWNAFVANRVGEVQRMTRIQDWRHVPSAENPADILSRGMNVQELKNASLWWSGPDFLRSDEEMWPSRVTGDLSDTDLPEQKRIIANPVVSKQTITQSLITKFSDINKIIRIIAYCLRFGRKGDREHIDERILPKESKAALLVLVRGVQGEAFAEEHRLLKSGRALPGSSSILSLAPFLDDIIRVGERLKNSAIPCEARHPILLPKRHEFTRRLIRMEHKNTLHSGVQSTLTAVRQRYWPVAATSTVRGVIRECVTCFKAKPTTSQTKMANLPKGRVIASRPFTYTGIDYAGPILIKESKRRNAKMCKAYIAVFVCFAVRAVHIEIVNDLTSDTFIGALKRFISRRGKPECIYSDNGTNFVGANKALKEMYEFVKSEQTQAKIKEFVHQREINWKFSPPYAPHFGGLWEAAVKSIKTHMHRILGNAHLTYEETQTVLCEIEAILNSRPLTPLSSDPNDLSCMTPGHFLIGAALYSFPVAELTHIPETRLSRWQRVEQLRQQFWQRWIREYLHTLIQRSKWHRSKGEEVRTGQLVLIEQPALGPQQWLLGRVIEVNPGEDGIVRAATLKTKNGEIKRPIVKLAVLPLDQGNIDTNQVL